MSRDPVDTRGAVEPLAAASDAACDPADRIDLRDRAVERRAGAEPAGALQLRPRGGDVRRRANGHAGRPQRRDLPAATLCRSAPRRLAGISRSRRPPSDRRTLVPAVGHRARHAAGGSRQCAGDRTSQACSPSSRRPEKCWWRREVLTDLDLPEGATPHASDGTLLPPLRVQAQLVPGVLVVDIGMAQRLLKMPDQVSRLLIGKTGGQARAARKHRRRPAPPGRSRMRRAISNVSPTAFIST